MPRWACRGLALPGAPSGSAEASEGVRDELGEPAPLDAVAPLEPEAVAEMVEAE